MLGLLPDNLLQELLETTGAYEGIPSSRIVQTGQFKRFDFQPKKKSDFDIGIFEDIFDVLRNKIEDEWRQEFYPDCKLVRQKGETLDLAKAKVREGYLGCVFSTDVIPEPFFLFLSQETFFFFLNQYLGGQGLASDKKNQVLTEIELGILKKNMEKIAGFIEEALALIFPAKIKLEAVAIDDLAMKNQVRGEALAVEMAFPVNDEPKKFVFAVPSPFLNYLAEQKKSGTDEAKQLDPIWQRVVSEACMDSVIEVVFKVDRIQIGFGASANMKPEDVLPWDKPDSQVIGSYADQVRMIGTIGRVDGNYAVRVDEIVNS